MASETKTVATTHTGWGVFDGRVFNNNVCRSGQNDAWYYTYTYGFRTFVAGDIITGVRIRTYQGYESGPANGWSIQLTQATTRQGTAKSGSMGATTNCANCGVQTKGSSSDLWGMTAAALKTLLNNSNFGVAHHIFGYVANTLHIDGSEIVVYYTPAPGYGHEVSQVLPANIAKVSQVITANIAEVSQT